LEVNEDTIQEKLEQFLHKMDEEVLVIVPNFTPSFQLMGATSKLNFLLIVEKTDPKP
jgi:hypothetical protein